MVLTNQKLAWVEMIYNAPSEQEGREALDEVTEKWQEKYPRAMKRWYDNWDAVSPIFKFSKDVRGSDLYHQCH